MDPAPLLLVLLGLVGALANKEHCLSGQYTKERECCKMCPPGEGVIKPCKVTQTVCAPCLDSETFSGNLSHTEKCQLCTQCTGLLRMDKPCTDISDATCVCNYGYFLNTTTQTCKPCTKCAEGWGMLYSCEFDRDTVCEECPRDTYSDQISSLEPCIPCASCDDGILLKPCTAFSDTVCKERFSLVSTTPFGIPSSSSSSSSSSVPPNVSSSRDPPLAVSPADAVTNSTDGLSQPIHPSLNGKLIPIYCSILAAVVVGLVAFIIFKRWNSCKQNKQGANNCSPNPNQTPSPEGEKLHSDSGISVDSQSLQEQQGQTQTHTVVTMDEEPCLLLPFHAREKVEKLLRGGKGDDGGMEDSDWCNLAGLLGYEEERIATFRQEEHPVRALLSDWASRESASVDALCAALRKINRGDVAQSLALSPAHTKPTATSVV